ncbi:MAG: XTP/dITP diphosphatase [Candidatus Micrarchaeia archaeon]
MDLKILFVTGNDHKFSEAQKILNSYAIKIKQAKPEFEEPRGEDCEAIAFRCASLAYEKLRKPLFVEDAGLFIPSLKGFPGALSAWVFKKIGNGGILRLMEGKRERGAYFCSAVAFADEEGIKTFVGICRGKIAKRMMGSGGFGFDPIFIPKGKKKTFAQDAETKMKISHRTRALRKLAQYILKRY